MTSEEVQKTMESALPEYSMIQFWGFHWFFFNLQLQ